MRAFALAVVLACAGCSVTPPCPTGLSRCGGECVDELADTANCGACYFACKAGEACKAGVCTAPKPEPSCTDGKLNGTETAIDCGGSCTACPAGSACVVGSDCASGHCKPGGTCSVGTCDDGVLDGDESDVDCGGSCGASCGAGGHCLVKADCDAGDCLPVGFCGSEGLTLSIDRATLVASTGAKATVTATLVGDGAPLPGQTVSFSCANYAVFADADGGSAGNSAIATTNAQGMAQVQMLGNSAGTAVINADALGHHAQAMLEVVELLQIVWVSTTCNVMPCTQLGSAGSGYNETVAVTFHVIDTNSNPVAGTEVLFSAANAPPGTRIYASGVTDAAGNVSTLVESGPAIGSFSVHAAASATVTTDSPTLTVVGAKPTNRTMVLGCSKVNLAAYATPVPPVPLTVQCTVGLADRYFSPVRTGAAVDLHSEAGSVPGSAATSTVDGTGTFTFNTLGSFPPIDVAPLAADPAQPYPGPRDAEPSRDGGANPRDGLVTVLAYVQGEEWFNDVNLNGLHDATEPFVDQSEPLVDSNDNGVWDPGELYIDSNLNNQWDGPNGVWDSDTIVWTDTTILYTDISDPSLAGFAPNDYGACPAGLAKGSSVDLALRAPDRRFNLVEGSSTVTASHTADAGTVAVTGALLDSYGFNNQRVLLNATGAACDLNVDPVCSFKRVFETWGGGQLPAVHVTGAPVGSTNACIDDTLTVTVTTHGVAQQFSTTGAIQ